ncbi:MAG: hypothetical protein B5766_07980 [Candidatus Lumbricidophila eiseniae]|uniref:Short-chain dehydrogenase n=1 Tax=Candidatus Lumbricidiphila eiseniae TaxID=1969409 RepID=A0A2A6FQA8_9MICO|nr:MAG: hypothetical protein B5766_07980 [Candidatus Lumbricidophila eiseniae]
MDQQEDEAVRAPRNRVSQAPQDEAVQTPQNDPARLIVVTGGAGGGIGQGISRALAVEGWSVVIADREEKEAIALADQLVAEGLSALGTYLDVVDESTVNTLFREFVPKNGKLCGLVNSAGVGLVKTLGDVSTAEWDRIHTVNLRGAFLCAREAIAHFRTHGGGSIVNIGSVQAIAPEVGYSTYSAAKTGMIGLTRGIAADHGRENIRCNIIHPGLVDSPLNRQLIAQWGDPEAWIRNFAESRQMLPSTITPEEIGAAVAFLMSHKSRSITGVELPIDGGNSIWQGLNAINEEQANTGGTA